MAAAYTQGPGEGKPWAASPRPKGRADYARNIPCRNIQIYGYCKHEKDGCMYNHEAMKSSNHADKFASPSQQLGSMFSSHDSASVKRRFNVESPSFTPTTPEAATKANPISPKAASAAPFTPKAVKAALNNPSAAVRAQASEWSNPEIAEFVPQGYQQHPLPDDGYSNYDTTSTFSDPDAAAAVAAAAAAASLNPYAADAVHAAASNSAFFQQPTAFNQPLSYHLYAPVGPHRENLLAYQRTAHDFFIPEDLRSLFQRRADATLQVLPNSNLPTTLEYFHSLVPLDTNNQRNTNSFGYNSWIYKATSSKDGNVYALRRIEGFRLTTEKAIRSVQNWKRVNNPSIVSVLDCFTTRAFGDSSLVVVTDYHPLAKTLGEQHFTSFYNPRTRSAQTLVPEQILWSYLVQLVSALRAIHSNGLAARVISPTKVIVTGKNRIQLNACGVLDVVQPNEGISLAQLHLEDIRRVGKLMLAVATNNPNATSNPKTIELIARTYSERLRITVMALVDANPNNPLSKDANSIIAAIADQVLTQQEASMNYLDEMESHLQRELESSRLFRLVAKLDVINDRPEYNEIGQGPAATLWSDSGERYYLKLFRDYVFHQVNADGRPAIDLGHIITTLNKLDAGSEEKIMLTSRDEQTVMVVTFKEIKRALESSFQDLIKNSRRG